jgi:hypothetical protein
LIDAVLVVLVTKDLVPPPPPTNPALSEAKRACPIGCECARKALNPTCVGEPIAAEAEANEAIIPVEEIRTEAGGSPPTLMALGAT